LDVSDVSNKNGDIVIKNAQLTNKHIDLACFAKE
jgi:hypothetical protein